MYRLLSVFLFLSAGLLAQNPACFELPRQEISQIEKDVTYLASDDLGGRKPGTEGDLLARKYISTVFSEYGLDPVIAGSYEQEFSVPNRVDRPAKENYLSLNGDFLEIDVHYYPVRYSANQKVEAKTEYVSFGIEDEKLDRDDIDDKDVAGRIAVMEISSPDGIHPHSKYKDWHDIPKRVKLLKKKGAKAVILILTEGNANSPKSNFKELENLGLPVVYVADEDFAKKLKRKREVSLGVKLLEIRDITYNLVGQINNGAPKTIIFGAHFDHLGMGGEGSRYTGDGGEMVHNGADDNASGTAGLLALARYLSTDPAPEFRQFNYLFLAFSAEEMGLLGSKHFCESIEELPFRWHYMFNMDMIGRMEDRTLAVNGTGTSPLWNELINRVQCDLQLQTSESGVGPSDHTNFYYQNIPVLHFFTGTHEDYHKPSDDAEKINFEGIYQTLNFMLSLVRNSPSAGEFPFSTTKIESRKAPKFSVTLGVMPDYMYSGNGMKIDGVSPEKPAAKAGLKAGDIVTQLGKVQVSDMQSYMEALSQFKKGDQANLLYKRNGEVKTAQVQF